MGARLCELSRSTLALLCWASLVLMALPRVVIQENVEAFPARILIDLFNAQYVVVTTTLDCIKYGWPVRRNRRITVMLLRKALASIVMPWPRMATLFTRTTTLKWKCFLIAEEEELAAEVAWASGRPTSSSKLNVDVRTLGVPEAMQLGLNSRFPRASRSGTSRV